MPISILLIESDPLHAQAVVDALADPWSGWKVDVAASQQAAVAFLGRNAASPPDIVLAAQRTVDGSAFDLLRELDGVPALIIVRQGAETHAAQAMRYGFDDFAVQDPALMDYRAAQRIGIESCLTSNIQTSTVAELAAHPLKTFLEHGIRASINTDDPGVQGVDIIHEYTVAAPAAGLSREQIRQAQINGLEMAFLSAEEKRALREKVAAK